MRSKLYKYIKLEYIVVEYEYEVRQGAPRLNEQL